MHFRVGQLGIYREEWVGTKEEETLHIRDRSWDREKQCWKKVIPGSESFVGLTQGKQTICVKVGVGDGDDDDEVDAWCQCVSGPGESLSIQNWPYPPTTSTRYTSLPLKPPTAHYKHTTDTPPKKININNKNNNKTYNEGSLRPYPTLRLLYLPNLQSMCCLLSFHWASIFFCVFQMLPLLSLSRSSLNLVDLKEENNPRPRMGGGATRICSSDISFLDLFG